MAIFAIAAAFQIFSGADACGNSFEELKRDALDVVQRVYDGSEYLIPVPTSDTAALQALDMDDGEGVMAVRRYRPGPGHFARSVHSTQPE